uniref:Rh associated glycoprotein n=1 Tax=Eptatretus burgeri TaxID=7764 RepID=A0A8C4N8L9_EPTBU
MLVLYGVFVRYDQSANARYEKNDTVWETNEFYLRYSTFQDVHVMVFVGFGFLMTFLKFYGYSSVAFNLLVAALGLQWAVLIQGFLHQDEHHKGVICVGIMSMINADFCSAAVLISFGAVLGKTSPVQLLIMAIIEETIFAINEHIAINVLQVNDAGGSMVIHVFGAYFGLMVSRILYREGLSDGHSSECATYHSDIFAMIGTLYLWLFWPSFNSAIALKGDDQMRAVINTYFSLAACVLATYAASSLLDKHGRLDMVHIQNATLAGGVAVGTCADMMLSPFGAMILGMLAGFISTAGYKFLSPVLASKLNVQDTCGVHNLHGIPGLIAAVAGALVAAMASEETYGKSLYLTFPQLIPSDKDDPAFLALHGEFNSIKPGSGRSPAKQGAFQIAELGVTLAMALAGGAITGLILRLPWWGQPSDPNCFSDHLYWELPEDSKEDDEAETRQHTVLQMKGGENNS